VSSSPVRYFEDFKAGDRFESASLTISERLILEYARFYDPQVFHTDPEAAKATVYGGLIASGLQTIGIAFKLFFETGVLSACSLGSPGLDEIRWKAPARRGRDSGGAAVELEARSRPRADSLHDAEPARRDGDHADRQPALPPAARLNAGPGLKAPGGAERATTLRVVARVADEYDGTLST